MKSRLARGIVLLAAVVTPLALLAAAPGSAQPPHAGSAAPDVAGGPWINSAPLTLAALRGRVVAVEFWTYG
jgi:ABC-type nitrate/sulfonate/bicarbonate transport system substrate-binding protein